MAPPLELLWPTSRAASMHQQLLQATCKLIFKQEYSKKQCQDGNDAPVKVTLYFQGYRVFWPTARNTNLNNLAAAGEAVTSPSYAAMPSDCRYSNVTTR